MARKPKQFNLAPAEGRSVPQADGSAWPAEGLSVVPDRYVRRRMADGDLVEVPRQKTEAAQKIEAAQKTEAAKPDPDPGSAAPRKTGDK